MVCNEYYFLSFYVSRISTGTTGVILEIDSIIKKFLDWCNLNILLL